jgi:serine protease AprX
MHRIVSVLIIIFTTNLAFSDSGRLWVYFTDKSQGRTGLVKATQTALSQRALDRRTLRNVELDSLDLPVLPQYIKNISDLGVTIHRKSRWFNAVSVYLNQTKKEQILALPFVKTVSPVLGFKGKKSPLAKPGAPTNIAETDYGGSDNQNRMLGIPEVHNLGYNGENVRIALFDTGFLLEHEALQHVNVIDAYDFVQGDDIVSNEPGDSYDQHNHGTMVLGVIGGYMPGKIIGPAYGAEYILAKTENVATETHVEEDNWVAAVEWADSLGADIISSSLGYSEFDAGEGDYTYQDMDGKTTIVTLGANRATEKGIAVFSSAGNEGNKKWQYIVAPSDGNDVISMGGVMADGQHWIVSSHGPSSDGRIKPDLAAQGQSVYTIAPSTTDGYLNGSGTSFSCPLGAGAAALIYNMDPTLTSSQLGQLMKSTASQYENPDNLIGYGIIDLVKAVSVLKREHMVVVKNLNASAQEGYNILSWSSQLEIDNAFWSVWRGEENEDPVKVIEIKGETFSLKTKPYVYNDFDINGNRTYRYILSTSSGAGATYPQDSISVLSRKPNQITILSSFPNPFNQTTIISFSLDKPDNVRLEVYDINGRKVTTLIDQQNLSADYYTIEWNGLSGSGAGISSGNYFLVLRSSSEIKTHKMLYLK